MKRKFHARLLGGCGRANRLRLPGAILPHTLSTFTNSHERMEEFLRLIEKHSGDLFSKYAEQKAHVSFKRDLVAFLDFESAKLAELRSLYKPQLQSTKFLNAAYFADHPHFARHQDIPAKYFVSGCDTYYFISHRWQTPSDPDPEGRQCNRFKAYFEKLPWATRVASGFFYDFSCIPQKDQHGVRTAKEELVFAGALKVLHILATLSHTVILFADGILDRSWCCAEWIFASSISPLLIDQDQIFPFGNAIKFRHLALLILFLSHENDMKERFMSGEDRYAVAFINSLLMRIMESTEATWGDDKLFLNLVLHRHFWYHVRALGLRNQLATAFLLLNQYDEAFIRSIFKQFLFLTADPGLSWTKDALIEIDTMLLDNPDPFQDVHFHNDRIQVVPHSHVQKR